MLRSRALVGFFLLSVFVLLCFLNWLGEKSSNHKYFCLGLFIVCIPVVVVSFSEILRGFRVIEIIFCSFFTLFPSFLFIVCYITGFIFDGVWLLILMSILFFMFLLSICAIVKKRIYRKLAIAAYFFWNSFLSLCFLGWCFFALSVGIIACNDIFAFVVGKSIGKIRCFKWSPSKTLEGFLAPLILVPFLVIFIFWCSHYRNISYLYLGIYVFFICILSSAGDLFFSAQKRILGIKDFSKLLGKHGGFWDRFDSYSFGLSLATILTVLSKFGIVFFC